MSVWTLLILIVSGLAAAGFFLMYKDHASRRTV